MAWTEDEDVTLHRVGAAEEALRHDVFGVDGVGVRHKAPRLLEPRVDALHVAVRQDVGEPVHLGACGIVAQIVVQPIVPIAFQPPSEVFQVQIVGRVGLRPCDRDAPNEASERRESGFGDRCMCHLSTSYGHPVPKADRKSSKSEVSTKPLPLMSAGQSSVNVQVPSSSVADAS